ncbi:hypothetical protein K435DRAFT_794001 [Dendrothele bispora CBS 962.96]|uniref:Myb/SANT-like domain-containing protein n=1 Tax=Dendrothele bispora (strain CBS 962.96) TaxID=1314807 RepID=A0A4S8MF08_DENBC|nr:hypothetical protein K435DRAFT_794001 [Dendrothele bispora CBS 962.96]
MARDHSQDAKWSDLNLAHLVDFFHENRFSMGEGGNPKKALLTAAAEYMKEKVPVPDKGGPKTPNSIRHKFTKLKAIYEAIQKVVDGEASGLTYTNSHGCNIQEHNAGVWNNYIKTHPDIKDFCNKGWPLSDCMNKIVPHKATAPVMSSQPEATDQSGDPEASESLHLENVGVKKQTQEPPVAVPEVSLAERGPDLQGPSLLQVWVMEFTAWLMQPGMHLHQKETHLQFVRRGLSSMDSADIYMKLYINWLRKTPRKTLSSQICDWEGACPTSTISFQS